MVVLACKVSSTRRDARNMIWEHSLYVPSEQKVNVSITLTVIYSEFNFSKQRANDEKQLSAFIDQRLAEIDGFVLFDPTNRYEVDLRPYKGTFGSLLCAASWRRR